MATWIADSLFGRQGIANLDLYTTFAIKNKTDFQSIQIAKRYLKQDSTSLFYNIK